VHHNIQKPKQFSARTPGGARKTGPRHRDLRLRNIREPDQVFSGLPLGNIRAHFRTRYRLISGKYARIPENRKQMVRKSAYSAPVPAEGRESGPGSGLSGCLRNFSFPYQIRARISPGFPGSSGFPVPDPRIKFQAGKISPYYRNNGKQTKIRGVSSCKLKAPSRHPVLGSILSPSGPEIGRWRGLGGAGCTDGDLSI